MPADPSMTRILHVVECFGAGVGRAVQLWPKLTPEHEHHLLWEGEESPAPHHAFSSETRLPRGLAARIASVDTHVRSIRPQVVIAHSSWAGVYTRARRPSVPVLYAPHAYKFEDPSESGLRRAIYRTAEALLARRSLLTLTLTPREDALARSLSPRSATHLVPNSPTVTPTDGGHATGFDPGSTVVMIGRVSRQKDPAHFIEVARTIRRTRPAVNFVWAGEGDAALTKDLEDAGVRVTGWLDRQALIALLSEPAVYFHSAIYEGFPLSVLDAVVFEHPVVVRAIPPFDGLGLLSTGSAPAAARAILAVLDRADGYEDAVRGSRGLTALMSRDSQASAMRSVVAPFQAHHLPGTHAANDAQSTSMAKTGIDE